MGLKEGDKVYIVSDYTNDSPELEIVEVKNIYHYFFECNAIIGTWSRYAFEENIDELDFTEIIIREYFGEIPPDYVTTNEKLALEKYKELLKEHGII